VCGAIARRNAIRGNFNYNNDFLNINLRLDGVTLKDEGDINSGPNDLLNAPMSLAADFDCDQTTIIGVVSGGVYYRLANQHLRESKVSPEWGGEGQHYFGSTTPNDEGEFSLVANYELPYPMIVSATATDADGSTSEFSTRTPVLYQVPTVARLVSRFARLAQ
jgi:hypothetical protein